MAHFWLCVDVHVHSVFMILNFLVISDSQHREAPGCPLPELQRRKISLNRKLGNQHVLTMFLSLSPRGGCCTLPCVYYQKTIVSCFSLLPHFFGFSVVLKEIVREILKKIKNKHNHQFILCDCFCLCIIFSLLCSLKTQKSDFR